jgi:hypothetical protein
MRSETHGLRHGLQDVARFASSERRMRATDTEVQLILAPMGRWPRLG